VSPGTQFQIDSKGASSRPLSHLFGPPPVKKEGPYLATAVHVDAILGMTFAPEKGLNETRAALVYYLLKYK